MLKNEIYINIRLLLQGELQLQEGETEPFPGEKEADKKGGKQNLHFVTCTAAFETIETKVDALKVEIGKGTKEMRALQLMIQTYTNTPQVWDVMLATHCIKRRTNFPKNILLNLTWSQIVQLFSQFGNAAKFQPELNVVAAKVQKQEAELSSLQVISFF